MKKEISTFNLKNEYTQYLICKLALIIEKLDLHLNKLQK